MQPFSETNLFKYQNNPSQPHEQFPDPNTYQLNQSFFTRQELLSQSGYQVFPKQQYLYFGGTHNSMKHGWGVLATKNTLYQGKFSLNHKMGKGYMKFANNSIYIGDFTNDKPHGQGMLQYNQQYYIGDFENGAMQGDGLWKNKDSEKYVGEWRSNKAHGYGVYVTQNSNYQGQFVTFMKHGYGVQNFKNGDSYRGNYLHGKPHGIGQYRWAEGAIYNGQFKGGFRDGQGQWTNQVGDKYVGSFSGDRKNGEGEYIWSNGNHYKGQFCEDMREGQGEMNWNDGSNYKGQWQHGLPHGKGIFKVKGEKPRAGLFEENVLVNEMKNYQNYESKDLNKSFQDSSLLLAMIPEMTKRKNYIISDRKFKNRKRVTGSTNPTMSFMTPSNHTWRSRTHKR